MIESLEKVSDYIWKIPTTYKPGMRVPGLVYASKDLLLKASEDKALEQVANVAFLPGIVKASIAAPDIHWGYGFPIGGIAAMDADEGTISPGGVGFDINCGVRLLKTELEAKEVIPHMQPLMHELSRSVPKGVGRGGRVSLSRAELTKIMVEGARWAVGRGFAWADDLEHIEENGCLAGADPDCVSEHAFERGAGQSGTLGAGNHFLEVQEVVEIFEPRAANIFGLFKGQVVIMVHSGSRGLGHQVASDYIKVMDQVIRRIGLELPDRQLACAPTTSDEGKRYYGAMACAVNYAFVNRSVLAHWVRESFESIFKKSAESMGMRLLYDVCHNIAKFEEHEVEGKRRRLCVHRKGATRAFGPGSSLIPATYRDIGQPVIIPGDMGTASYVLVGTEEAMKQTFGSTCHGAGRMLSRGQAKKQIQGAQLKRELEAKGITVVAGSVALLSEEAPAAYKNVSQVVEVCEKTGISKKVARMRPLGVLKG